MNTRQTSYNSHRPGLPRTSVLGLILFMLGASDITSSRESATATSGPATASSMQYVLVALIAGTVASIVELSLH